MALNRHKLADDILAVLTERQRDQAWTPRQVADGMAAAIDTYLRAGDVNGVRVTLAGGQTGSLRPRPVRLS